MDRALGTVGLLTASNTFMTFAWYYHLKEKSWPLWIAFFEYCLQVPANRLGHAAWGGPMSAPQLKIIQEAISLTVCGVFSIHVLGERLRAQDLVAFGLVLAAVAVATSGRSSA